MGDGALKYMDVLSMGGKATSWVALTVMVISGFE